MLGHIVLMCIVHIIIAGPTNLALKKPTNQSSTASRKYRASRAVDGLEQNGKGNTVLCAYTLKEKRSWWQVDLQSEYLITSLRIFRRTNDYDFKNLTIEVKKELGSPRVLCYHFKSPTSADNIRMKCKEPVAGRYVRITKTDHSNLTPLILCEVQVFSEPINKDIQDSVFKAVAAHRLTSPRLMTAARSRLHCAVKCLRLKGCLNFHYKPTRSNIPGCELDGSLRNLPTTSVSEGNVYSLLS